MTDKELKERFCKCQYAVLGQCMEQAGDMNKVNDMVNNGEFTDGCCGHCEDGTWQVIRDVIFFSLSVIIIDISVWRCYYDTE